MNRMHTKNTGKTKRSLFVMGLFAAISGSALASGDDCQYYPKSERMSVSVLMAQLEAKGIMVEDFEVDDNCYEIEGKNAKGQTVEMYIDMKTGEIVHSETDD